MRDPDPNRLMSLRDSWCDLCIVREDMKHKPELSQVERRAFYKLVELCRMFANEFTDPKTGEPTT